MNTCSHLIIAYSLVGKFDHGFGAFWINLPEKPEEATQHSQSEDSAVQSSLVKKFNERWSSVSPEQVPGTFCLVAIINARL